MRFVTFKEKGTARLGGLVGGEIADLSAVSGLPGNLSGLLRAGEPALVAAQNALRTAPRRPLDETKLLPVIPKPGKIICLGLNYLDHVKEGPMRDNIPKFQPIFFRTSRTWGADSH